MQDDFYDVVAVGTGFSTSFFLHRLLSVEKSPKRVLVLEAGKRISHTELLESGKPHNVYHNRRKAAWSTFDNETPEKGWNFSIGFGGSSNCWWAGTPRMQPEDFRLKSTYGVGVDWPISYDDLEPYYCDAEALMSVSGSNETPGPWPMSKPYPEPAHAYSAAGKAFKAAFPDKFFPQATARQRGTCCASNLCGFCPLDAKFTIENGAVAELYDGSQVTLKNEARVSRFEHTGDAVRSVVYLDHDGVEHSIRADLVVLGANAIFNPFIMLSSGLQDLQLGRGLVESVTLPVSVEFDDFQNWQGSTAIVGQGFMLYAGEHRSERAAALLHLENRVAISHERGRWLSRAMLQFSFEDFRQEANHVAIKPGNSKPVVTYHSPSEYCERGMANLANEVPKILDALDLKIRSYEIEPATPTDSHIQGTHAMGNDAASSVVDAGCVHHRLRNLVVLGGGVFPTAPAANPTLTISAIALRSADKLAGG